MDSQKHKSLIEDKPLFAIIKFSIFFIIGDLLQQLYNVVDSAIVGNFVSEKALAAVGAASPIMSLVMFVIVGFTIGSGIVISRYYGKQDFDALKKSLSTSLIIGFIFTLVLTILSFIFCRLFLIILKTPEEILKDASYYLYIIFAANFFTFIYNFYCYAIRAIGNSFTPLIFLVISTIINAILDILFVIVFKWGIEGAASATLLAQFISCLLIVLYANKKVDLIKLSKDQIILDKSKVKEVLSYSTSVALQQSFVYIGRIGVQGLFNSYGTEVIAGVNAAEKINAVMQTPFRGYANAATTYYSQNFGANKIDRIFNGYKSTWLVVILNALIFTVIGCLLSTELSSIFMEEESTLAIGYGADFIFAMSIGLVLAFIIVQHQSFMRGVGNLKTFFVSTLTVIVFRIIFSYLFDHLYGVKAAFYAPTAAWIIGVIFNLVAFVAIYIKRFKKVHLEQKNAQKTKKA